jgi:ankyrin repeat protein
LIAKGANSKDVINKNQLVHRFISRTDNDYYLKNREVVIPILLTAGNVNVNLTDTYERTILQLAMVKIADTRNVRFNESDKEFVNYLLNAGVDPNIPDNKGNTALHNSIKEHNFNLSQLLIDNGADLNLKNKRGKSSLCLVEYYLDNDDIKKGIVLFSKEQQKELMELKKYIDETI